MDNLIKLQPFLYESLAAYFNLDELKSLCYDLRVEYEDLPGEPTRHGRARELVRLIERQERLNDLLVRAAALRPHVEWQRYLPAEPEAISPYKGLLYFDEADAPLFFGREQVTAELIAHLRQHRFLAVVGASGSGKSSVVRAGVIPAIRHGEIPSEQGSSAAWPIHVITPGDEPLKALAATLTRASESVTATKTLLGDLQTDSDSLDLFLYRQLGGTNGRLLLIVDQFEELFTQCRDAAAREMFVGNLVTAVSSGQQARLTLILTLRADFYAQAVQLEALRPLLETSQKIIGAMTPDELRQAIEGPAAKGNWALQPGLVETMLQDVGREPGALPLLSHALQETWARREGRTLTLAGYQAAGGVRQAIAQTANDVYASLTPEQQAIARNIFLRLTELGEGTEDTRRRVALAELLPEGEGETAVLDLLDLLARRRLVTLNRETAHAHAEVAHEALIREWPVLRGWLDENREGLRLHRQLTEAAGAWQASREDASFLYRGGRLAQAQEWAAQAGTQLSALERQFLTASQIAEEQEAAEREAQRQRELTQAQQLAEAQAQRARTVRQALIGVSIFLILAVAAAIFGFVQSGIATDNANLSATREAEAIAAQQTTAAESNARGTQEAIAIENADLAATRAVEASNAQATAEFNAQVAATREAEAVTQAQITQSQALASASLAVGTQDPMRGLLLAIAAGQTGKNALAFNALRSTMPRNGRLLRILQHDSEVNGAIWNQDESLILTSDIIGSARIWDAKTGEELVRFSHGGSGFGIPAWNRVQDQVLTWGESRLARVLNSGTGEEIARFAHDHIINGGSWNKAGDQVLTWNWDGTVRIWDVATETETVRFSHEEDAKVLGATWNDAESKVLTWNEYGTARIWDTTTGEELIRLTHVEHGEWEAIWGATWNSTENQVLTWSADGTARIWNVDTGEELARFSHGESVRGATWNGAENQVLTWSWDGTARVWDALSKEELFRFAHKGGIEGAAWNNTESQILTWGGSEAIKVWDAVTGLERASFTHGEGEVNGASWNSADNKILTWGGDRTARVWNVDTGLEDVRFVHEDEVGGAIWNNAESQILTWSRDGTARLWAMSTETEIGFTHNKNITGALWNSTESQILAWGLEADLDDVVWTWDAATGEELNRFDHEGLILGAVWNERSNKVLTWSFDGIARVWNAITGLELSRFTHGSQVNGAIWNKTESRILTWSFDGTARIWDAETEVELIRFLHDGSVWGAIWNQSESQVLTWSDDWTARVWDAATGAELVRFNHDFGVNGAVWNQDETQVLTWSDNISDWDGTARVWNALTGEEMLRFSHEAQVNGAIWNKNQSQVLTWSDDWTIRLWDAAAEIELANFVHEGEVHGADWNRDESLVLSWGTDKTARVWDVAKKEEFAHFTHEESLRGAAWNDEGTQVLTWSDDSTVQVWDVATGSLLFTLAGDDTPLVAVQWGQDERRILLVTEGGFVGLYYTQMPDLLEAACQRATRNFTWTEWQLYFPGQPYRLICDQWPAHDSVPEGERP